MFRRPTSLGTPWQPNAGDRRAVCVCSRVNGRDVVSVAPPLKMGTLGHRQQRWREDGVQASRSGCKRGGGRTVATHASAAAVQQQPALWNAVVQAFYADPIGLLASVATCVCAMALVVLVVAAIPALVAFKKSMSAMEELMLSLQDEIPDTMSAVRLSGLEIADAVEEVSGLGSDLTAGIRASARALVGAESGFRMAGEAAAAAGPAIKKNFPRVRDAAEEALQQRAKLTYSSETVEDVARATKVAAKRLRTALATAQIANSTGRMVSPFLYSASPSPSPPAAATEGGGGE